MSSQTSEGLRNRLFLALDQYIEKKISAKDVEGICYLSEQILKTAQIEIDIQKAVEDAKRSEREFNLRLKKEEREANLLLKETIDKVSDNVQMGI
jgi:hypothetical protein